MATAISRDHVSWNGRRLDLSTALTVTLELDDALLPRAQDLKRRLRRLVSSVGEAA